MRVSHRSLPKGWLRCVLPCSESPKMCFDAHVSARKKTSTRQAFGRDGRIGCSSFFDAEFVTKEDHSDRSSLPSLGDRIHHRNALSQSDPRGRWAFLARTTPAIW